jgi:hypothetical protein
MFMRKYQYGVLVFIAILLGFYHTEQISVVEGLSRAVQATGATVCELRISGYSRLPVTNLSDAELAALTGQALEKIGVKPGDYELKYKKSERERLVWAEVNHVGMHIVVVTQVIYPVWNGQGPEAYMVINIEKTADTKVFREWHNKVAVILTDIGGSPRINTCLVGWLDGKLEKDEWLVRLNTAAEALGAGAVDKLVQPNFASVTGYSPVFTDWVQAGDKRVNLNMAMRVSPYDNRTYVIIGSPVITGEY